MHELYELKDKLIKELEDYSQNGKFSKEDVESIKYMASAVDHLCNIMERKDDEEEYSMRSRRSYEGNGNSYARGRRNARRDSMGRYSTTADDLVNTVRSMMSDLPPHLQTDAQRFVQKLEDNL